MNFLSLLEAKRDGQNLGQSQITEIVQAYTNGEIPDYQMSSFLMAVYFQGMAAGETAALTLAVRDSGSTLRFPNDPRPIADKHSTGGVGDKVSLPLAPLLACLGFRVPMISGRGLGITGGTLDKLESIPGFRTALEPDKIIQQVQSIGCVICGQTADMVPADKSLYALRDVTGTVPSIPLITASILSKKLAENPQALILDVKFGTAAFMQTKERARALAESMVTLGHQCGVNTRALLTDMNVPLGRAAGNWLEVKESVECLENRGPADVHELVIECAAHLLVQTGRTSDIQEAQTQAEASLQSGEPRRKWDEMLRAQGADLAAFQQKLTLEETAPILLELCADKAGFVSQCDARIIGEVIRDLGGGRLTKETVINPAVGVDQLAKPGEPIQPGNVLARIHAATQAQAETARDRLQKAFQITNEPPSLAPLIQEVIE
ncbi:MAG: thymidine phosphorylase [Abitibacteriaceae bacterium]|nr:thymidine phosphorylase [Abditibacteriaceae bacterium]MBV9865224.1 thymidine phosphorylase [Abditibacteriaceae bacterium]